jgi:release factor glutamine methyltransferase
LKVKDTIRFIIDSIGDIYGPGEAESIAFILLDFVGFAKKAIFRDAEVEMSGEQEKIMRISVEELKKSKPVQYILGETEFYGLKFMVDGNVLIPRQETEELVLNIIRDNKKSNPAILDLGTGSGCISVTLAKNIPSAVVFATDISKPAQVLAQRNAFSNNVQIKIIEDNMLQSNLDRNQKFDIIVSNPPYVRNSEKQFMHANVLNYEPSLALFVSDENPLIFYEAIAEIALTHLVKGGILYVEINEAFGMEVVQLFRNAGLSETEIIPDIHDKNRFVKAIKL